MSPVSHINHQFHSTAYIKHAFRLLICQISWRLWNIEPTGRVPEPGVFSCTTSWAVLAGPCSPHTQVAASQSDVLSGESGRLMGHYRCPRLFLLVRSSSKFPSDSNIEIGVTWGLSTSPCQSCFPWLKIRQNKKLQKVGLRQWGWLLNELSR